MTPEDDDDSQAIKVGAAILASMDEEFHDAPDRTLAIVGGAYLDLMVCELLRASFVEDEKETEKLIGIYGPLGANGSRCRLAYCLGLISAKERDDLAAVANIRNAFAHQYAVTTFDHEEATKHIRKLHFGKDLDATIKDLLARSNDELGQAALRNLGTSARYKFRETVFNLFAVLVRKLDTVSRASSTTWFSPQASAPDDP